VEPEGQPQGTVAVLSEYAGAGDRKSQTLIEYQSITVALRIVATQQEKQNKFYSATEHSMYMSASI